MAAKTIVLTYYTDEFWPWYEFGTIDPKWAHGKITVPYKLWDEYQAAEKIYWSLKDQLIAAVNGRTD